MNIYISWGYLTGDVSQSLKPPPGVLRSSENPFQPHLGDLAEIPRGQLHSINPQGSPRVCQPISNKPKELITRFRKAADEKQDFHLQLQEW